MARNFHPERHDPRGLQKNQRALEILLDQLFDSGGAIILSHDDLADLLTGDPHTQYLLLSGRSGGQTILQGVTVEGGFEVGAGDLRLFDATPPGASPSTDRGYLFGAVIPSGVLTEVSGQLLTLAVNMPQVGARDTARVGAIVRLDTRSSQQLFSVRSAATGGSTEVNRLTINLETGLIQLAPAGGSNVAMFGAGSFGGGVGVLFLGNRMTAPTSNPAGGGVLSIDAGIPKYIGPTGSESVVLTGADNLASLVSAATARTNLGLLSAALRDVGVGSDSEIPDRGLADARYAAIAPAGKAYWLLHTDGRVKQSFYTSAAPEQWERETAADLHDTMIRLVTTGGGTAVVTDRDPVSFVETELTAITEAQMPAHTHAIKHDNESVDKNLDGANVQVAKFSVFGDLTGEVTRATTSAGSGQGHLHEVKIRYADFLVAKFTG